MNEISVIVSAATIVIYAVTATVALVQLRHLQVSYWITAASTAMHVYWTPQFQEWMHVVQFELPHRLEDAAFRDELCGTRLNRKRHPELLVCEYFAMLGAYVRRGYIPRDVFLEGPGRDALKTWMHVWPAIQLIRESGDATAYEGFEYIAVVCQRWLASHPDGAYPKDFPRFDPLALSSSTQYRGGEKGP